MRFKKSLKISPYQGGKRNPPLKSQSKCVFNRILLVYYTKFTACSSVKIINRSFRYASLCLWNQLPASFCQPHPNYSSHSTRLVTCFIITFLTIHQTLFHSKLKTHLFHKSFPPQILSYTPDCPLDFNRTAFTDSLLLGGFCFCFSIISFVCRVCRTTVTVSDHT